MKSVRIAAAALFVRATALAQSEGVAEFKGTMSGGSGESIPNTSTVYFSKVAYRMEMQMDMRSLARKEGSQGMVPSRYRMVTIQKLSDLDHLLTLNEDSRTYSVTDLKKVREDFGKNREMPQVTYTVRKLGRDSVAGFACEKALVTSSSGSEMELCISIELFPSAAWLAAQNRSDRSGNLFTALRDNGLDGFPIRWIARDKKDQRVTATMELSRFERKPVSASLFEVPPGYRETSAMGVMMTPEQEKAMKDALEKMTPEQRKMYEEMMKKQKQ
jgi:hypothetical protein